MPGSELDWWGNNNNYTIARISSSKCGDRELVMKN